MIELLVQGEQVGEATTSLLDKGVLGLFCFFLIIALIAVWRREQKTQERLWKLTEEVKSIMGSLTSVVSSIFSATEKLPESVKKELQEDINIIKTSIERIESNMNKD